MQFEVTRLRRALMPLSLACVTLLSACGGSDDDEDTPAVTPPPPVVTDPTPPARTGAWSAGDLHVHTIQSDDAQTTLESVLDQAFDRYQLDWAALSNHLRMSARDNTGANIPGGSIPFSAGMARYEVPFIKQAQAAGRYAGKIIFSSFEWDMPTHDHVNIGIGTHDPLSDRSLRAVAEFEYLYTNKAANLFDAQLVADLAGQTRAYTTHADSLTALKWLRDKHPDSYMLLNHPSRYAGKYTIGQLREMHDLAPSIFFAIEGMVGNQMEPDRGGYAEAYTADKLPNRTYGGVDYLVAKLGGTWDALLGEGRHIWTVADSDFHFRVNATGQYSSGYAPGEYAKTYVWKDGKDMAAVVAGLKSGRMFGVFGDLIDALEFQAQGASGTAQMGGELTAAKGEQVEVTIRFRSPASNHYEYPIESGNPTYVKPTVHHVDLIVGDVGARAAAGTPAYDNATNPSTRVLGRYTSKDWTVDKDGYNVIKVKLTADKSQYLRLRGTNLAPDVAGETANGEPLPDAKVDLADNAARFNAINARNYNDLWFYSNPVFVTVKQ
ncbi:S-layer protein [Achromobacter ruhlandii]|uniref:S-layer protein n=1 Tax=Achromobacter ruhlandii TaxID=72557 RepID=A0ABM8LV39_9BURK|nr:S-layer protein [Achromobacter ruhlandii]AKP89774.1 Histidinol phosphatase of the PHP family [Achromobacter xylosoxidans]AOU92816.1 histidinol phosphate phosphatase [Achromobacter ruhlandii]MCZ8434850.1 S-layer protein [Achromobacter ruhlandii]MDC6092012.1 S-layer protein [Achromobacter ruhlandii]MDC6149005.1 S-layer protein [Achromobacter ruhlandii]